MKGKKWLALVSSVLMALALYMVFIFVPTEATMGVVQRIFYFHVPVAWVALFAYFVVFAGSIMYLVKRQPFWDRLAHASGEIGFVFNTMFLITGSIWAKPIWGVWWTWTPRLTSALILWFIYIGYLLVRAYAAEEAKGARFAAVVGIIGFLDVPIVILAVTLWGSVHPGPIIFEGGLAPSMLLTLQVGIAAFTALYALLMVNNLELRRSEREIKRLKYDLEVS